MSWCAVRIASCVVLLVCARESAMADEPRPVRHSPARIVGIINRQRPWQPGAVWFTPAETEVMTKRISLISGLDGHGYDFPGAVGEILAVNPGAAAIAYLESMGVQSERIGIVDLEEPALLHSADPASLTVTAHNGSTKIWFLQDARGRRMCEFYDPPGVREYVVEWAPMESGRFTPIGDPIPDTGLRFYSVENPGVDPNRVYRVRSRIASSNELVDYSWTVPVHVAATSLAIGRLFRSGFMCALCYGDCPESADGARMDADLNNDREYTVDEQGVFETVEVLADGGRLYEGEFPRDVTERCFGHRVVLNDDEEVCVPLEGAYQIGNYNNRIQMHSFGSYLVWPNWPTWKTHVGERLADALAAGYRGMRLDFALDSLESEWAASGVLPDWEGAEDPRIADAMAELLAELRAGQPGATLVFNGYFVSSAADHYFRYLQEASGADFEFFAIGWQSTEPELEGSTTEAVERIWQTRAAGRLATALAGADVQNHLGRLKAFAVYLLAMDEEVYFYNETDAVCQDVVWLPEWEAALGAPVRAVDSWEDLEDPRGPDLLAREFAQGWVFYNRGAPLTVPLDAAMYELSVTGGLSPRVGGDGTADYTRVTDIALEEDGVAILLTSVPGDANDDGAVNHGDLLALEACLKGPGQPVGPECASADVDYDGFVDMQDYAEMQLWLGEGS